MNEPVSDLPRLRWKCRRGMLELDLLLERFIEHGYSRLSAEQKEAFEELLKMQDQDLQELFMRQKQAETQGTRDVIDKILQAAAT